MTYEEAASLARTQGALITHPGIGRNRFVFARPADSISTETVLEKVKSLPDSLKNFIRINQPADGEISFTGYMCMFANGMVVNGWSPAPLDLIRPDWVVIPVEEFTSWTTYNAWYENVLQQTPIKGQ